MLCLRPRRCRNCVRFLRPARGGAPSGPGHSIVVEVSACLPLPGHTPAASSPRGVQKPASGAAQVNSPGIQVVNRDVLDGCRRNQKKRTVSVRRKKPRSARCVPACWHHPSPVFAAEFHRQPHGGNPPARSVRYGGGGASSTLIAHSHQPSSRDCCRQIVMRIGAGSACQGAL